MKLRYTPAAMMDLEEIKSYIADTLLNPDAAPISWPASLRPVRC